MVYEFVIVGAGAYGCAVAYHLAKSGHSVRVLEAGEIAAEASGGGGKRGVRGNRRDLRELPLISEAYQLWPSLAEELGAPTGYVRTGGVNLIEKESVGMRGGMVAAEAIRATQTELGVPTEFWTGEKLRERLPQASTAIQGALYAPLDGVAGHQDTTLAYAAAARRSGAEITERDPVVRIFDRGSGARHAVETAHSGLVEASQAILIASNATARSLAAENFGCRLPTWTAYPQAVWLRPENVFQCPYLVGHDSRTLSVKVDNEGVIQLSGGWRGRFDPATDSGTPVEGNVAGSIRELEATFPSLGSLTRLGVDTSRAESGSVDQLPIIDTIPGTQGVVVATGWSGHGWALLPAMSAHIADFLATGRRPRQIDHTAIERLRG